MQGQVQALEQGQEQQQGLGQVREAEQHGSIRALEQTSGRAQESEQGQELVQALIWVLVHKPCKLLATLLQHRRPHPQVSTTCLMDIPLFWCTHEMSNI